MKLTFVLSALLLGRASAQNVVEVAVNAPDTFSTLVDLVVTAGLADTLTNAEDITVFAPTNDAFTALGTAAPAVLANLLTDEWASHLQDVLLYHVLPAEVPSSAVTDGLTATALNGEDLSFTVNDDGVFVNTASQVVLADVAASNGVIHAINNPLLPSWVTNTIVDRAVESPALTTLVDLVVAAGLAETLAGPGPFTVFAPTNDAFVEFLDGADPASLDMDLVSSVLTYHVVPGIYTAGQITDGLTLTTVQGEELTFTTMDGSAMVNEESIVATDILANNGIVHVIGGVLVPPMEAMATDTPMMKEESSASSFATTTAALLVGFGVAMGGLF